MPVHDFRCKSCDHVYDAIVKWDKSTHSCPKCENESKRVFLKPPELDWAGMAQGENAGPEFIDRFEKTHKKQAAKEAAFEREHGESQYGNRAPGS